MRARFLVLVGLFGAGCFGGGEDVARVRLSLDLGELGLPLDELPGPRDPADGLVHVDRVPAYVHVVIDGPGLETPLVAAWPSDSPRTPRERVELSLDVPVGPQRRFRIAAWVRRSGEVRVWADDSTVVDLLQGGVASDLAVTLAEAERGSIAVTLAGPSAGRVRAVLAVEGDPARGAEFGPGVAYPPVDVVGTGPVEIPDVPVGRPVTFRVEMDEGRFDVVEADAVTVTSAGERVETSLVVP